MICAENYLIFIFNFMNLSIFVKKSIFSKHNVPIFKFTLLFMQGFGKYALIKIVIVIHMWWYFSSVCFELKMSGFDLLNLHEKLLSIITNALSEWKLSINHILHCKIHCCQYQIWIKESSQMPYFDCYLTQFQSRWLCFIVCHCKNHINNFQN
jgi:hypothetical protein